MAREPPKHSEPDCLSNVKVINCEYCMAHAAPAWHSFSNLAALFVLHAAAAPESFMIMQLAGLLLQHGGRRLHSSVTCSCLEIYHEVVTDLLAPAAHVQLREDAHKEVWAEGAAHQPVASGEDGSMLACAALLRAAAHRDCVCTAESNAVVKCLCLRPRSGPCGGFPAS